MFRPAFGCAQHQQHTRLLKSRQRTAFSVNNGSVNEGSLSNGSAISYATLPSFPSFSTLSFSVSQEQSCKIVRQGKIARKHYIPKIFFFRKIKSCNFCVVYLRNKIFKSKLETLQDLIAINMV